MKIAFYGTKPYDRIWFEPMGKEYGFDIHFIEAACNRETIFMAKGYDAICIFVNDYVDAEMINALYEMSVKAILLRSAGYNNVDVKAAEDKIIIMRVPSYSPEAVAEFSMALLLTVNRLTHKAYNRTGKIGQAMIRILNGFQMHVLCYDPFPVEGLEAEYVSLEEIFKYSDVITLHCPLTSDTKHIINKETIAKMKNGVFLINTSRGALIDTEALIEAMLQNKFGGVGLDVYEEEEGVFYEDRSGDIVKDDNLARLLTFPNVLVTSHMGFFTREAMQAIALTTLENAYALENGLPLVNQVGREADLQ